MSNYAQHFANAERDDGTEFVQLTDDAPDWLRDAVYEAHDGELPNDWRYETARSIVAGLDEGLEPDEIAENLVDVYTPDLLAWTSGPPLRIHYVDEAPQDFGAPDPAGQLARGQWLAIDRMVAVLAEAYDEATA